MAFIRNKTVNGKRYNYLVETKREGGKVRSKTIVCLRQSISLEGRRTDLEISLRFVESCFSRLRNPDGKTVARYQNKINRLAAQIEYLKRLEIKFPKVTTSQTIRTQYAIHLPKEESQQSLLSRFQT